MSDGQEVTADDAAARSARRAAAIRRQRVRIIVIASLLIVLGLVGIFFGAFLSSDIGFQ